MSDLLVFSINGETIINSINKVISKKQLLIKEIQTKIDEYSEKIKLYDEKVEKIRNNYEKETENINNEFNSKIRKYKSLSFYRKWFVSDLEDDINDLKNIA